MQPVFPRKARSKRGSNRLTMTESVGSDHSDCVDRGNSRPNFRRSLPPGQGSHAQGSQVEGSHVHDGGFAEVTGKANKSVKSAAGVLVSLSSGMQQP